MRPLRVLYLHLTGAFGGSSRSLYEAVRAFETGAVQAYFVVPHGSARRYFAEVGEVIETSGLSQFDHTRYSHYRGLRWLVLIREMALLPVTALVLWRARKRWRSVDLVHLNEITGLVTLLLAQRWFRVPAIVHVRALVHDQSRSWRTRWVHRVLERRAHAVVAIDESVRATLPSALPVHIIHNAFAPNLAEGQDAELARRLDALGSGSFKVGFVGNLLRGKGVMELVEAARITRDRGLDVEFIIIGDDSMPSRGLKATVLKALGLRQSMRAEVESALDRYALRRHVHLLGFTSNIGHAYRRMDVLCFPSHYDAPGRPIFEAAFFGVPAIVAIRHPKPDTLIDGKTGLAIEPHSSDALADAIERMARDRPATRRMGEAAREMARKNFDADRNAAQLLAVYRGLVPSATT